jgi:nitrile hydratase accessory protein
LPRLPSEESGPDFAEPWHAQAFAVAIELSALGYFGWNEWASALSEELALDANLGNPSDGSRYYHCWLATLEQLVIETHLSDAASLLACKEAWDLAYRSTPHGMAAELPPNEPLLIAAK